MADKAPVVEKEDEQPPQGPGDHPFVLAVVRMMEHLAGQPKDGYLQPLYNDVRVQYRALMGHPEPVPDHVQEAKRVEDMAKQASKGPQKVK